MTVRPTKLICQILSLLEWGWRDLMHQSHPGPVVAFDQIFAPCDAFPSMKIKDIRRLVQLIEWGAQ